MGASSRQCLGLGALTLAAAVPRVAAALLRRPWHDEYFTAWLATLSPHEVLAALRLDSGPPLPYLLPWLGAQLGVPGLAVARGVAVLAGIAAVLLVWRAASRAWGEPAGWWAGALLAFHPLAVAWSSEGRAYALLVLATAWSWERLESLATEGRGAVGLTLAVAVAGLTHGLGILLAPVVAVAAWSVQPPTRRRALLAVVAGLAATLPWLPIAAAQPTASISWMTRSFATLPAFDRAVAPLRFVSPAANLALVADFPSVGWQIEVPTAFLVLALLLLAVLRVRPILRPLTGVVLSASGLAVLAWVGMPAFYPGRGEALYLAPVLLLVAAAASSRPWSAVAGGLVLLAGLLTTTASIRSWATVPRRGEQVLAERLHSALPQGGTVVIGGYWRLGLWYHLGADSARFHLVNVPAEAARHPGWYDDAGSLPAAREVVVLFQEAATQRPPRTAVVVAPGLSTTQPLEWLARSLRLEPVTVVVGGELWVPPAVAQPPAADPEEGQREPAP